MGPDREVGQACRDLLIAESSEYHHSLSLTMNPPTIGVHVAVMPDDDSRRLPRARRRFVRRVRFDPDRR